MFRLLPHGFANRDLRPLLAQLLGIDPTLMTQGRMTNDLRRLRLHGLIERIPSSSHRYQVTDFGLKAALLLTRAHNRFIRAGLAELLDAGPSPADPTTPRLRPTRHRHRRTRRPRPHRRLTR